MARPVDPLELLRRRDKHVLGAGDGVYFDPPHPLWLDHPGFWDGGHVFRYGIAPLFTLTLVEPSGRERALRRVHRDWTPAELVTTYSGGGLELEERRVVLPGGRFVSEWRATNGVAESVDLTLVAWTAQDSAVVTAREAAQGTPEGIVFARTAQLEGPERAEIGLLCTLRFEHEVAGGWALYETDAPPGVLTPEWMLTPFRERWRHPMLAGERVLASAPVDGRSAVYAGLSRRLRLGPGEADSFIVSLRVVPAAPELRPPSGLAPPIGRAAAQSRTAWQQYFGAAPSLASSDPYLERAFAYRWFGLRLASMERTGQLASGCVGEGPGAQSRATAGAACAVVRDLRWLADPERARGTLRVFFARQDDAGRLPAWVGADHSGGYGLAAADWGGAVLAIDEVHPDPGFLAEACAVLARAADAADRERDAEHSGLLDARARGEGQRPGGDRFDALAGGALAPGGRIKGVDVTVWQYRLRRALAAAAERLGRADEAGAHAAAADRIREAVRARLWDPALGFFSEVLADGLSSAGVRSAAGFLPFLTDIVEPEHLSAFERHLLDPAGFWTPTPVPVSPDGAPDGPGYRVRPAALSPVAEALARVAVEMQPALRTRAAELLQRFLRMQFFEADPARPNAFDAYRPDTGWPALRAGWDDGQRGWINDLLIRYAAGLRPAGTGLVVDPLPCGVERLRLERVPWRGRRVDVTLTGTGVKVFIDGGAAAEGTIGVPVRIDL